MICPYCGTGINVEWSEDVYPIPTEEEEYSGGFALASDFCPECNNFIVYLKKGEIFKVEHKEFGDNAWIEDVISEKLIYPKYTTASKLDISIPEKYKTNYQEAEQVLVISPKASATLSRYLLQLIFHEKLVIKKKNLEMEIDEFFNMPHIPSSLCTMLQIMRKVANFGAHPKKSTHSNEIVEVEKGEAEIMLEFILEVFDFIFVKPARMREFEDKAKEKYGIDIEVTK